MCGITAISRVVERSSIQDAAQFMRLAALAIEDRGPDATGFGWTRRHPDPTEPATWYWKKPGPAHEMAIDAPLEADVSVALGHTRWATQGDVKVNENNHPVVDNGIVLIHNGVITNDYELYSKFSPDFEIKAEVDSQVVASLLANLHDFGDHAVDVLKLIEGSAAVAWIDTADHHTLHLARLRTRPMTLGWTRRGDLIMSSTPHTLAALAKWAGVKIRNVREVKEGTYMRVVDGEIVEERTFTPAIRKTYGYSGRSSNRHTVKTASTPKVTDWGNIAPPLADDPDYDSFWDAYDERDLAYAEYVQRDRANFDELVMDSLSDPYVDWSDPVGDDDVQDPITGEWIRLSDPMAPNT